jgi:ATP-dependent 26S proteasome regulatory subunit
MKPLQCEADIKLGDIAAMTEHMSRADLKAILTNAQLLAIADSRLAFILSSFLFLFLF